MRTPFKQKRLLFLAAFLAIVVPLFAISYGHNLNRTLRVLRNELESDHRQIDKNRERLTEDYEKQRQKMIDVMKQCDELSLMLYSQKQGFTFDVSYALQKVAQKYNEFNQDRGPFDHIVSNLNVEMERHAMPASSSRCGVCLPSSTPSSAFPTACSSTTTRSTRSFSALHILNWTKKSKPWPTPSP